MKRLTTRDKQCKVSDADIEEREHWDEHQAAFEETFRHTSTTWAPWWVIPADHKWVARALIAAILTRSIQDLDLKMPAVSKERARQLAAMRRRLGS